ncbi:MAG TPA: hypothetical protein VFT82_03105 [Candidatus Paceibacterota bacterium]|nr:hypothetical protein [Candidatus Paceibacterota bacterium]
MKTVYQKAAHEARPWLAILGFAHENARIPRKLKLALLGQKTSRFEEDASRSEIDEILVVRTFYFAGHFREPANDFLFQIFGSREITPASRARVELKDILDALHEMYEVLIVFLFAFRKPGRSSESAREYVREEEAEGGSESENPEVRIIGRSPGKHSHGDDAEAERNEANNIEDLAVEQAQNDHFGERDAHEAGLPGMMTIKIPRKPPQCSGCMHD